MSLTAQPNVTIHPITTTNSSFGVPFDLLEGILNSSLHGIIYYQAIRDSSGRIVDFKALVHNRMAEIINGESAESIRSRTLLERHPDLKLAGGPGADVFGAMVQVTETGVSDRRQVMFETQGKAYDVSMVRLGEGLVVSFQDITEFWRQNQLLQQQNVLFDNILNTLTNGLMVMEIVRDENGKLQDLIYRQVSRQVWEDSRLTREQMINQPVRTLFPEVIHSLIWTKYQKVLETGKPQRFEEQYNYDGFDNFIDVNIAPLGAHHLLVNYFIDNDAHLAVHAVQKEAVLFKAMSSNVPDVGVLVVNTGHRIIFANGQLPAGLFTEGHSSAVLGQKLSKALQTTYHEEMVQYFREAGEGINRTLIQFFGDRVYEVYVGPVSEAASEPDNPVALLMAIYRDITQTRHHQRELEKSITDLRRSNENLEQFAYVASHDLQEPLRKIQAFGDILVTQYAPVLGDEGHDLIRRMQSASGRMAALIRDLLIFSRLTTQQTSYVSVDLNTCLQQAKSDLEMSLRTTKARLEADSLPTVVGDEQQLCRLLQNLLSNALKFTKPDQAPQIRISTRTVRAQDVGPLLADTSRVYHEISVSDNGIGFDEKYVDRIFVIFQRLHGKQSYAGTGIGLAICKKIVELHQGHITASSQPGQGATFRVYLPVAPLTAAADRPHPSPKGRGEQPSGSESA